ncbi:MAG: sigma-70 family RNA polymerase sigma factor [Planctomycetes bacterium]|nr:sigma-70 family RNA polymerase sigma factor [Planctomycetota bacterium]
MPDEERAAVALMPPTMTCDPTSSMALLLADAGLVRRLARSLTQDRHDADDLAQEACLQALRSPPLRTDNLRGWLLTVMQNLLRQRHRAGHRRQQREQQAPRKDHAPATADLVERASTHRTVVDAVIALEEPYRTVVLLRFFEELPPRAIAERLAVPVATVHTRITRGLERLRAHLDRTRGRRQWCAALAPLPGLAVAVPSLGVLAMKGKSLAVAAAVLVSATAVFFGSDWLASGASATPGPATAGPAPVTAEPPANRTVSAPIETSVPERQPVAVAAPTGKPEVSVARRLRGRVVDGDGRAAANLPVTQASTDGVVADAAPTARAAGDGSFELTLVPGSGRVVVTDDGWQTVLSPMLQAGEPPQFGLVVAAPAVALAGAVRGPDGQPIADARVQVVWPADLRSRLTDIHDASAPVELQARSRGDGAFALLAAAVRGAQLLTTAQGWLPDRRPLPDFSDRALAITLQSPAGKAGSVLGQVIDPRGVPVAKAAVGLGRENVRTDELGNFVIPDSAEADELVAAAVGFRACRLPRPTGGFPPFVMVELGATPLSIRGRVVDHEGKGLADVRVWLLDATILSSGRDLAVCEGVAGGAMSIGELMAQVQSGKVRDPETTFRNTPTAAWPFAVSGTDGSFVLGGLEARTYALRAMDARTLLMHDVGEVEAGRSDLQIRMPTDTLFARVSGVVVARSGAPVAGVRVRVQCDTVRVGDTNLHGSSIATTTTDAEGRFALTDVPKTRAYLRLDGEVILPVEFGRDAAGGLLELSHGDAERLRIEVGVRVHVQIELGDRASADEFLVLDERDEPITINIFTGRGRREQQRVELNDGRSVVFVVPDHARTLVLRKAGTDVRREVLNLRPGEVNTLRL